MAHWGFRMWRNDPKSRGRVSSEWKTGYTVQQTLRGTSWIRFRSLAEIERQYLPTKEDSRDE
jgi:hypothetical protein